MIDLKSREQLRILRDCGRFAALALRTVAEAAAPGVTTRDLADLADETFRKLGCRSAFLGYQGFPGTICVSVNEEVIHGIPGDRTLMEGDLVSIDLGVKYRGFFGDNARTVLVGTGDEENVNLMNTTRRALENGIAACRPGRKLSEISHAVEQTAVASGFSVVRDFVGHGIGKRLHEEPQVPNFGAPGRGPVLRPGMVLCIEPMVNAGTGAVVVQPDGWTAVTRDRRPSAHFEHMVAVTDDAAEILTKI